jgi:predicted negative regulator of RcsB-dependent stress response
VTKLSKEVVKSPDKVKASLEKSMEWMRKNVALVAVILVAFVGIGAAWSIWDYFKHANEEKLQADLSVAVAEKDYFEKKSQFREAAASPKSKDKKEISKVTATGDLQKDYGSVVERLNAIVQKEPKSNAAAMAALYLAEIHSEYKQAEKALEALNKVSGDSAKDVLSSLVLNLKAGLLADQGSCDKAIGIWDNVTKQKKASYLHEEAKLRMALCYEKINDVVKAEQLYTELSKGGDSASDRAVADDAKKYLRLLKIRASGGT